MTNELKKIFETDTRREAQYYALLAWNGKSAQEAEEIITKQSYADVDKQVDADDSIKTALSKIEEKQTELAKRGKFKAIVEIIVAIHDKWVQTKANKYDRGNEEKSKKQIFQHLPTAMIGLDEVAKDLMFLAPFLAKQGIDVGQMEEKPYGAFIPSKEFADAFNDYVKDYMQKHRIESAKDLEDHIVEVVDKYPALKGKDELATKRRNYMKQDEIIEILASSVATHNKNFDFGVTI